jgi:hypothetical protein
MTPRVIFRDDHDRALELVMELLHEYSGLKQRMIGERFGGLDDLTE